LFLRFNASKVTLPGFAGGEYLPLPGSEGLAFPFRSVEPFGLSSSALSSPPKGSGSKTHDEACSPSMGTPLLRQIALRSKGVTQDSGDSSNMVRVPLIF